MTHDRPRPGSIHIPHWILHAAHLLATVTALVVVLLLAADQRFGWLQHSPGGEASEVNEQPFFMAAFALGALLALRWQLLGGAVATFTASALVVFANRQLRLFDAIVVFVGFLLPALLWLMVGLFELRDEKFHRSPHEHPRPLLRRRDLLGGLAVIAIAATGGIRIGRWLFDRIYGPTHLASGAVGVRDSTTRWLWSGAVTDTSAAVTTRLEDDDVQIVRLVLSTSDNFDNARSVEATSNDEGLVRVDIDGLEPDTSYRYSFVVENELDSTRIGRFRTCPVGPSSFSVVVASCARTGSNGAVFDTIREVDPTMVIIDGDLHYADIVRNDQGAFRQIYDHTVSRPGQEAMFATCPVAYVWDDHDFGGSDASSNSRPAAMATYRQFVPHYPLASSDSTIHQAFTIGRVRFLLTDVRSDRRPGEDEDAGTMLGQPQKQWLMTELLSARESHALTVWVNPVPWISTDVDEGDGDDWGAYASERAELADFIADNDLAGSLLMASGDAHMLAIDDGTNSDYSSSGGAAFPILHAAALDRPGSVKGGPYSHGAFPGGGQFGVISVTDTGGSQIEVQLSGRNWRNDEIVAYSFVVSQ